MSSCLPRGCILGDGLTVARTKEKGRVLVNMRTLDVGDVILHDRNVVRAAIRRDVSACARLLDALGQVGIGDSKPASDASCRNHTFPTFFYWAAVCSLTADEIALSPFAPWPTMSADMQESILDLFVPCGDISFSPAACEVVEALWQQPQLDPIAHKIERLAQVWVFNAFNDSKMQDELDAAAISLGAAMCSHSCSPNAIWCLSDENGFVLRACAPIDPGDEVVISYLDAGELCLPTPDRREGLLVAKAFFCRCSRCESELDDARAFQCPRCGGEAFAATSSSCVVSGSSSNSSGIGSAYNCLAGAVVELCSFNEDEGAALHQSAVTCVSGCGPLGPTEAAALLAAEFDLRPLVRHVAPQVLSGLRRTTRVDDEVENKSNSNAVDARPKRMAHGGYSACLHEQGVSGRAVSLLKVCEAAGISGTHWILDVLRAIALEENPAQSCRLLRERAVACEERAAGGPPPHAIVKLARLRLALGTALLCKGDFSAFGGPHLERSIGRSASVTADVALEAIAIIELATETLSKVFGEEHHEFVAGKLALQMATQQMST